MRARSGRSGCFEGADHGSLAGEAVQQSRPDLDRAGGIGALSILPGGPEIRPEFVGKPQRRRRAQGFCFLPAAEGGESIGDFGPAKGKIGKIVPKPLRATEIRRPILSAARYRRIKIANPRIVRKQRQRLCEELFRGVDETGFATGFAGFAPIAGVPGKFVPQFLPQFGRAGPVLGFARFLGGVHAPGRRLIAIVSSFSATKSGFLNPIETRRRSRVARNWAERLLPTPKLAIKPVADPTCTAQPWRGSIKLRSNCVSRAIVSWNFFSLSYRSFTIVARNW